MKKLKKLDKAIEIAKSYENENHDNTVLIRFLSNLRADVIRNKEDKLEKLIKDNGYDIQIIDRLGNQAERITINLYKDGVPNSFEIERNSGRCKELDCIKALKMTINALRIKKKKKDKTVVIQTDEYVIKSLDDEYSKLNEIMHRNKIKAYVITDVWSDSISCKFEVFDSSKELGFRDLFEITHSLPYIDKGDDNDEYIATLKCKIKCVKKIIKNLGLK